MSDHTVNEPATTYESAAFPPKRMIAVSPRLGELLTRTTQSPDLETAVWKVLSEYVEMKVVALTGAITRFEQKWEMSFDEFSHRCKDGTLKQDPYSWEVEQDFWAWEQAVTLLQHYHSVSIQ